MATYVEQSLAALERFEGSVPWMYLDTVGKVTVAVGLMLPDVAAATALPFELAGRPATPAEIAAEYARVEALPMGRPAQFYRRPGRPELPRATVTGLLARKVAEFEAELRAAVAGYDLLPDGTKLALLDMIYNLGPRGLLGGYPRMLQAIAAGNFTQAATQCVRRGPSAARNEWTRRQLLSCVVGKLDAESEGEGTLKRLGYGLVGAAAAAGSSARRWLRSRKHP